MKERRLFPRYQVSIPAEMRVADWSSVFRVFAVDVSLGGCYIRTRFPFSPGAQMDLALRFGVERVFCHVRVVTCDPHIGNGVAFSGMLAADLEHLSTLLDEADAGLFSSIEITETSDPVLDLVSSGEDI